MFLDYEGAKNRLDQLIVTIERLSNSKRQLSLSALDFQSMGLASKHQKEKAIEQAEEVGDVLEDLIKLLKQVVCEFYPVENK